MDKIHKLVGFITKEEGMRLHYLASLVPKELAIVEIGSYKGKSTCYLAAGSRDGFGAKVYAIDLWDYKENKDSRYNKPEVFNTFQKQVAKAGLHQYIKPIVGNSLTIGETWDAPIGLLFIDGNHEFESVRADYNTWAKYVCYGMFIAFHDYDNPNYPLITGPKKFIEEIFKPSELWRDYSLHGSVFSAERNVTERWVSNG